jgi:hypothetical protein
MKKCVCSLAVLWEEVRIKHLSFKCAVGLKGRSFSFPCVAAYFLYPLEHQVRLKQSRIPRRVIPVADPVREGEPYDNSCRSRVFVLASHNLANAL